MTTSETSKKSCSSSEEEGVVRPKLQRHNRDDCHRCGFGAPLGLLDGCHVYAWRGTGKALFVSILGTLDALAWLP